MKIKHACNEDILWLDKHDKHIAETTLKDKIARYEVYIAEIDDKKV